VSPELRRFGRIKRFQQALAKRVEQRSTAGDVSSDAARRRNRSTAYGVVVLDSVIRMQKERDFLGLSVTDEYELIEKWAPIAGRWEFPSPVKPLYIGLQQPNVPFGICVSNIRFSEGK
jgi:hypothetical protein